MKLEIGILQRRTSAEGGLRRSPLDLLGACLRHELRPNVACRTAAESKTEKKEIKKLRRSEDQQLGRNWQYAWSNEWTDYGELGSREISRQ